MTTSLRQNHPIAADSAPSRWRALLPFLVYACWAGLALLAVVAVARLTWPDRNLLFIWLNAYTFWIFLPAYLVAVGAAALRRWSLLAAGSIIALFHVWWVLPDYTGGGSVPEWASSATQVQVMTLNLKTKNPVTESLAGEIADADPDIVLVQEFGPGFGSLLEELGVADRYPYRQIALETPFLGMAVYSKFPLMDAETLRPAGRQYVRAELDIEGLRVVLYAVHPASPFTGAGLWNQDWQALTDALASEDGPVIVAGDFNMTQHHRWHGKLKDLGLVSAHEALGRGNASTWKPFGIVPAIRLDHVFVSEEIAPIDVREGEGAGSDHRPIIASLALAEPN